VPRKLDYIAPLDEKAIGARIKELRNRRGMSQLELARKLGMDQSLLSRYERGALRLHGSLLASLAKAFRTSTDEILGVKPLRDDGVLKDRRFLRRVHRIDGLSKRKKQALLTTIDSFLNDERDR
jgi:transcriptional regulator with XRE-family HTH domain